MQHQKDLAIVLRAVAFQDRHRIVTALTEQHGLVSALAKNSVQSRRFGGTLELFTAAEWHFTEKPGAELYFLQEAQVRRSFEGLRKDLGRLAMGGAFNELILKLAPKNEVCEELFKLHSNALAVLDEMSDDIQFGKAELPLLNAYLAKLLQWSGNQPQLQACLHCQMPIEILDPSTSLSCVIADAGWVCENCRTAATRHVREREGGKFRQSFIRVTPAAVLDFYTSLSIPIRQVLASAQASSKEHQELFHFLEALFIYHLPGFDQKPLKSLRFLGLQSNAQPFAENLR